MQQITCIYYHASNILLVPITINNGIVAAQYITTAEDA